MTKSLSRRLLKMCHTSRLLGKIFLLLHAFSSMTFVLMLLMFHLRRGGGSDTIFIGDAGSPYEDQVIKASMNVRAGQTSCPLICSSSLDDSLLTHSYPPHSPVSNLFPESLRLLFASISGEGLMDRLIVYDGTMEEKYKQIFPTSVVGEFSGSWSSEWHFVWFDIDHVTTSFAIYFHLLLGLHLFDDVTIDY